jgi:FMN-dependent NADH-azoreductase
MKLLHLDASINGEASVTRQVTAAIVAALTKAHPGIETTYRDLAAASPAHVTLARLPAAHPLAKPAEGDDAAERAAGEAMLEEFLAADIVVIGAPMYNFAAPTQLKAWIDRIVVPGRTFRYGQHGPEGLAGGKQVFVALSRGGLYGPGAPAAGAEHAESWLRAILGFIGITPKFILAEGLAMGPDRRAQALEAALGQAVEVRLAA